MLLGFSLSSEAIATNYTYKTIDPPAGGRFLSAKAINDRGQVVGSYYGSDNNTHGFIYANGLLTTLDIPITLGDNTFLTGINSNGQVVGSYYQKADPYYRHGILYSNGTFTTVDRPISDSLPFGTTITINLVDINDNGQILGNSDISYPFPNRRNFYSAFIYDAGNAVDIFVDKQPICKDINASGQVICNSAYNFSPYLDVLFYDSVSPLEIAVPYSEGVDVKSLNASGQFVGNTANTATTSGQGFLYRHGTFTTLPNITFPDGSSVPDAWSINASGQIVGIYSELKDNIYNTHGFVYDGGTYKPFDIPGASGTFIFKNNNKGQLLGRYSDSAGNHDFIATPVITKPTTEKQCKKNGWKKFGFKNRKACIDYVESLEEDDEDD